MTFKLGLDWVRVAHANTRCRLDLDKVMHVHKFVCFLTNNHHRQEVIVEAEQMSYFKNYIIEYKKYKII